MVKRTRAQAITDDLAFPVRIKVAVPSNGLGVASQRIAAWLTSELGSGHFAWHAAQGIGTAAMAFYFRSANDAQRFVSEFPELELADGTRSQAYVGPNPRQPRSTSKSRHDP